MSVRRLADVSVQPDSFAFSSANADWAAAKIAQYPVGRQQSAVIPLLWRAQEQEGWISRAAIETVARMLDMAYIRVLEVATFYTQFLLKPVGTKAHITVCGTTPCMLRGAEELRHVCEHRINHHPLETNAAGTLSWEEVECLGACCNAPMAAINDYYYEDLTPESLGQILDDFAAGESPQPGSYEGRKASEPKDAIHTLTDPKLYDGSLAKPIKKLPNAPEKPGKAKKEPAA